MTQETCSSVSSVCQVENVYIKQTERKFTTAVLLDLDSTLFDFHGSAIPFLEERFGKKLRENHSFNLVEEFGVSPEELLKAFIESDYMDNMEVYKYAREYIDYYRKCGFGIVLSTSRTFSSCCKERTLNHLLKNDIYFDELHLVNGVKWKHKPFNPNVKYFIYADDAPYHIEKFIAGREIGDPDCPNVMHVTPYGYNKNLIAKGLPLIRTIDLKKNYAYT